ncbi:MAG: carboxypeptidase-like regulatory domain-containing protein, partial [Chitinophagales bacterium]
MTPKQLLSLIALSVLPVFMLQFAFAQDRVISGKVIDSKDRSALTNVSVIAKGTQTGTQTDSMGNFRLTVPLSVRTLTISAIGFAPQDVDISTLNYVEVALISTASSLDEVVVIGYGTAKKKDITGAVASVSEKDFNNGIFASPDKLIQGKVSGVQIIYNNGQPGGAASIKVRG